MRYMLLVLVMLSVVGCGSVDAVRAEDSGAVDAGKVVPASWVDGGQTCYVDSAGYTAFFAITSIAVEGGTCGASYTIRRGTNTLDCTCADPALCSQASTIVMAAGQHCLLSPDAGMGGAGGTATSDAGAGGAGGMGGASGTGGGCGATCVPSNCYSCDVNCKQVSIPGCGIG